MPIHDWTRVDAGTFHHFQYSWIDQIQWALNEGILPRDCHAMVEQWAARLEPDVLTLRGLSAPLVEPDQDWTPPPEDQELGGVLVAPPQVRIQAESADEFYRRKRRTVVVRHASRDNVVAAIEIVSPGNKDGRKAFQMFVDKTAWLLDRGIHLLIVDVHPPTARDPHGLHAAIREEITGHVSLPPVDKPLTLVAYEAAEVLRAYAEPVAVGDAMPDMPLFLVPGGCVLVPLERAYQAAWQAFPRRWMPVLAGEN
jgi:hypothetical protein